MPPSNNRLTRRALLGSTAGLALTASARAAGAERPNILWIIAEDFSPDLGCYGNRLVHTPNIDRLAAGGVRFERAFITAPVCSAARSAIATGMYQTSIGAHHHRSHRGDGYRLPNGIHVFTHYFRQAGYHTSNVLTAAPGVPGAGKTDLNFTADNLFDGTDWDQRRPDQPFYAQINFPETHRAFRPFPDRPIDPARIALPPYYADHPAIREDWAMYLETAQNLDVKVGKVLERLEREQLLDDTIVFFFGDHGRPMPRDKQFLYEGGIHIPLIVRFPDRFLPPRTKPGTVRWDLVSSLDITASSLALAGVPVLAHMQGQAVFGRGAKRRDYIIAARDRCDETMDRIRCVRTERFKYIRNYFPDRPYTQQNNYKDTVYPTLAVMRQLHAEGRLTREQAHFMADRRPVEELYDLREDPHEIRNLAGSSAHRRELRRLSGILERWIKQTRDRGESPEDAPPEEDRYRTQVEGWCTRHQALASSEGGALRVEVVRNGGLFRSFVADGGDLEVRFRARSAQVHPGRVFWATIRHMRNGPAEDSSAAIDFTTDGEWRECAVAFRANSRLGLLGFEFAPGPGTIEFDWIAVHRQSGEPLARWDFGASPA